MAEKKYFWLKLFTDFFNDIVIKIKYLVVTNYDKLIGDQKKLERGIVMILITIRKFLIVIIFYCIVK